MLLPESVHSTVNVRPVTTVRPFSGDTTVAVASTWRHWKASNARPASMLEMVAVPLQYSNIFFWDVYISAENQTQKINLVGGERVSFNRGGNPVQ